MRKTNPIFRVLAIVLILASLGMVALPWLSVSAYGYTETESYLDLISEFVDTIDDSGFDFITENTQSLLFAIATILLVITAILSIILAACGVRGGGIPFFVSSLLCAGYFIYAVSEANRQMGMNLVHIGIGAILCAVFALIAMILLFIPDNTARPATAGAYGGGYAPVPPRVSTWTCPKCGTILADRERFCPNCGNSRAVTPAPNPGPAPAVQRCASCGATLEKGASFCPNCGSPVGGARPAAAYTAPRTPSYPAPSAPSYPAPSAPQPQDPAPKGFHSAGDDDL